MALPDFSPIWSFTFGILGNIISFLVFFAPVPTFYRIWRKKSTEGFKSLPYVVAFFSCLLWLSYALLKGNEMLLITINSCGLVIETIYIIIYLKYADTKKSTIRLIFAMTAAFFLFIAITHYSSEKKSTQVTVFGWICTSVSVAVFISPLSIAARVIRTKSVEFMPISLSICLTLSAVMWFGYGFFQKDKCIAIPNIIGFLLGLSQMILYAVYRKSDEFKDQEKLPDHVREIVGIEILKVHDQPVVDIVVPISTDGASVGATKTTAT